MIWFRMPVFMLAALSCAVPSRAQDSHPIGITMGYPASVGLIVPISHAIAIRPAFTLSGAFQNSKTQFEQFGNHSWNLNAAFGVLVYLHKDDRLRTYVVPEFDYLVTSETVGAVVVTAPGFTGTTGPSTTSRLKRAGGAASFGARYAVADRFALYGEAGFGFSHSGVPAGSSLSGGINTWGTRGGVGVVFYP